MFANQNQHKFDVAVAGVHSKESRKLEMQSGNLGLLIDSTRLESAREISSGLKFSNNSGSSKKARMTDGSLVWYFFIHEDAMRDAVGAFESSEWAKGGGDVG